ncbi:MAG: sulfur carrier protein ThiS [Xanthomonadaceae bacterium]|nr:sulfur carrier protein ThiS [Xanthomonadaceae bacterium]
MGITVNGAERRIAAGTTLAALIDSLGLAGKRLAVEVNGMVVPRSVHATHEISNGDRVEVVHAIGGG